MGQFGPRERSLSQRPPLAITGTADRRSSLGLLWWHSSCTSKGIFSLSSCSGKQRPCGKVISAEEGGREEKRKLLLPREHPRKMPPGLNNFPSTSTSSSPFFPSPNFWRSLSTPRFLWFQPRPRSAMQGLLFPSRAHAQKEGGPTRENAICQIFAGAAAVADVIRSDRARIGGRVVFGKFFDIAGLASIDSFWVSVDAPMGPPLLLPIQVCST